MIGIKYSSLPQHPYKIQPTVYFVSVLYYMSIYFNYNFDENQIVIFTRHHLPDHPMRSYNELMTRVKLTCVSTDAIGQGEVMKFADPYL